MTLAEGSLLNNRYRIIEILGRGGMGAVYRATDESLAVDVALKENLFTTEDYARQFRMEAVILAGIRHPNLPRVTDHFVINETGQYLVMDYIDGDDLRQKIERDGPISEAEAIRIGAAACEALAYLHSRKPPIFHRDIKLGNIKIDNTGQVYLVDFGLAKMGWEHEETMTGARAMTPGYSPPEQYGSARTDARSDIYSLGATLYAALTGVIPEDSLIRAIDGVSLTPLREHRTEVSIHLAKVIEKALETNSGNRYQTADAFRRALLGQSDPETKTKKIKSEESEKSQKPEKDIPNQSTSFWRLLGFFLVMLTIVLGTIWLNPRTNKILENRLPFLMFLSTQIASPSSHPVSAISSKTAAVVTVTQIFTISPTITPNSTPTTTPDLVTASSTPHADKTAISNPASDVGTPTPNSTNVSTPSQTPPGGGSGEIAFAGLSEHVAQIYMLNSDGTNLRQLTNLPGGACSFDWSPDGKKIIYISPCTEKAAQYPKAALFFLDLESKVTQPLPFKAAGDFEPAWSPDNTKIAFTSMRDGSMQIYVYNLSDSSLTSLTSPADGMQSRYAAWSPDSSQIAYTVLRFGLLQIWSMATDGSNKKQLLRTGGTSSEYLPAWSPTGESLLFSQTNNGLTVPSALVQYIFKTKNYSLLPIPRPVVDPAFSPDGQWIAYETTDTINQDIYIYRLPDGSPQRLTNSPEVDFDPAWRPGY